MKKEHSPLVEGYALYRYAKNMDSMQPPKQAKEIVS